MEKRIKVGQVTQEEMQQIQRLFERRNGLSELAKVVTADNDELYERLVADMGTTSTQFQQWWDQMAQKYGWQSAPDGHWEIDFNTCEIFLHAPA